VDFELTSVQASRRSAAADLGRALQAGTAPELVIGGAARSGLLDPTVDLVSAAAEVEALAYEASSAGVVLALHLATTLALDRGSRFARLRDGTTVAALALSTADVPRARDGRLTGRASWVAPVTEGGLALVGAREEGGDLGAFVVPVHAPGLSVERLSSAGLDGLVCADLVLDDVPAESDGSPVLVMSFARTLVAAAGIGMGRRALREALAAAKRAHSAAAGEQTVQGLLADAATELDAASMLLWKAAAEGRPSLGVASMAKLAAGSAAQGAVARATQVIGADSFQRGHVVERLAQDVRALELFAGRTEALRDAAAAEILPRPSA
jgi:alkylation response protein AidB-like acyl-CoA dehydrogenase